jgi:hypothetical protein
MMTQLKLVYCMFLIHFYTYGYLIMLSESKLHSIV